MDFFLFVKAIVLGIIQGLTEFLPISSSGHLIIGFDLLNYKGDNAFIFSVIIQLASVFAVMWEYRHKLFFILKTLPSEKEAQKFSGHIILAFLPAAVLGVLFSSIIENVLFNPFVVATTLVIGGFIILIVEKKNLSGQLSIEDMSAKHAIKIGFAQCLAMIPGTSRSGATIIGGMLFGLNRRSATEFSFFLAIPTMLGASAYEILKTILHLGVGVFTEHLGLFAVGFITSFIFSLLAIKALLKFISTHSFSGFGWYRIAFGLLIFASWYFDIISWNNIG